MKSVYVSRELCTVKTYLDHYRSDKGARETDSQEGECRKKKVDAGSKSAVSDEDSKNAGEKRDEDEADCNDVEHEHGCHERVEGIDSVLDVIWPVQVLQGDVYARLVDCLLDDGRGVELVGSPAFCALGDVLANVILTQRGVSHLSGLILSLAVVEHVCRVPVLDANALAELVDLLIDFVGDAVGDGVGNEVYDG